MALPQMVAGGNIAPCRFVMPSTVAGNTCLQATAGALPIGISQRGTRNTPYSTLDDGYAAIAPESLTVYGMGQTAWLELGGTVAPGDVVKSDGDGKGVTASAGDKYGARAPQGGTSGKIVEVYVMLGELET